MSAQLAESLDLFDSVVPERGTKPRVTARIEGNPFSKQYGACAAQCGTAPADPSLGLRVFYCHACGRTFCWICFREHKD
jgi:hypothetical protein